MSDTYPYYTDPGHGWLKVPVQKLVDLGIENKITPFSYMRGSFVYLEEDCDAYTFGVAYQEKYGHKPKHKTHNTNRSSKIRNYQPYCFQFSQV